MGFRVAEVSCPGCGAPWSTAQRTCEYCGRPVVITSLSDLSGLTAADLRKSSSSLSAAVEKGADDPLVWLALGATFLKLGQYDRASAQFGAVIDEAPGESEAYFYAAIAELEGKKPFLQILPKIKKVESLLDAALQIEPRGVYWLLRGYIVSDYYERKGLRAPVAASECVEQAFVGGTSLADTQELALLTNAVENPFFGALVS